MADSSTGHNHNADSEAMPATDNQPTGHDQDTEQELTLVGIGASAGGLEALRAFVGHLPQGTSLAYIIAQHLSPKHESMLVQLLGRETNLEVVQIQDGMSIAANRIYIAPANTNLVVTGGHLQLLEPEERPVPKPSVDTFFRSLADDFGDHAIGVVLSGTGSDGSHGVRAIKAGGGFTLAQAPETAKYDGMPRNAIETGCVDLIMSPDQIAGELQRLVEMSGRTLFTVAEQAETPIYDRITRQVKQYTGLDLSAYKEKTIHRRLRRRMAARHLNDLEEYLQLLESDVPEMQAFCQDILISVTSFFRDPDAFEALREHIDHLLKNRRPGDELRIWVPGCATGEEAYSLAILLCEMLGAAAHDYRIQIFATDLDEPALAVGRRGLYNASSLTELSPELVNRYFKPVGDQFKVSKALREMLVFARQNLLNDPPFLRLDLLSCRNLLIYFNNDAQKRVFDLFHYALKPGGILLLGKSENVTRHEHLFAAVDSRWKIFQHRGQSNTRAQLPYRTSGTVTTTTAGTTPAPRPEPSPYDRMLRATMEHYAPPAILVDEQLIIQHIQGDTSRFLRVPEGEPDFSVRNLVRADLRVDLAALVTRVRKERQSVTSRLMDLSREREKLRIAVHPVVGELDQAPLYLICFETQAVGPGGDESTDSASHGADNESPDHQHVRDLEDELATTREHLQTVIEELETSNEELQSSNEELQSSNEELQSSNEELETTNEELQSTNEELTTVNDELNSKTLELDAAYTDLENVKDSLADPLVVVDDHLRIKFHNPACEDIFSGSDHLMDAPILDLDLRVEVPRFRQRLRHVIRQGEQVEAQISQSLTTSEEGDASDRTTTPRQRHYLLRIRPYFDQDRIIRGAVITFFNNTRIKRAERDARESETRLQAIINRSPVATTLKDLRGRYLLANATFENLLGLPAGGTVGLTDQDLLPAEVASTNANRETEALRQEGAHEHEETLQLNGRRYDFITERFPLADEDGEVYAVCTKLLDITDRKRAEGLIRLQSKALDASINGILIADAQQPDLPIVYANPAFTRITGYDNAQVVGENCRFLQGPETEGESLDVIRHALRSGTSARAMLRNYRRDGTPFWNELSVFPVHDETERLTHFVGIQEDATQRVQFEQALQENEERLMTAQEFAGVVNVEWIPGEATLRGPSQLAGLIGAGGKLTGQPRLMDLLRRIDRDDRTPLLHALRQCLNAGQELDIEFRVHVDQDAYRWLHLRANAERTSFGAPMRLLGLLMDISRRKDVENALLAARLEAEQANRAKSEFLSHMSHELRTPLNAILGFAQLLEADPDHPLPDPQMDNVRQILRAGWHLLDLISEVLDLARIESGRLHIESHAMEPAQVIQDALRTVTPMAKERGITLDGDVRLPGLIVSDTTRLTQVLLNLLTNAIKYNRDQGRVALSAWEDDQQIRIAVSDTGIGIAAENLDELFESFNRLGQEGGRIQGTGIGLVLVKRIVDMLGGQIDVNSTPDEGSTFTVTLPLVRPDSLPPHVDADTQLHADTPERIAETALRILYIEDNPSNMALAREICRREQGIELLEATDGESGVALATTEAPDLILMDLQLPGMDGFATVETLKRNPRTALIPVIAVSADAMNCDERATPANGFADVVTKPLRIDELRLAVANAAHDRARGR